MFKIALCDDNVKSLEHMNNLVRDEFNLQKKRYFYYKQLFIKQTTACSSQFRAIRCDIFGYRYA